MPKRDLPAGVYASGLKHFQWRITLPADPATGKRRQEVRGGFLTPADAAEAREKRRIELGMTPNGSIQPDRQRLEDYLPEYITTHLALGNIDPNSAYSYRRRMANILPGLGHLRLSELTPAAVRAWLTTLTREKSATTATQARALLVQALQQAVRDEVLARNPAALVRAPRVERGKPVILTGDDVGRFLRAAESDPHAAMWYLAFMCQLRPGELAGLRWRDLDLDRAIVHVVNTRTRNEQGRWIVGQGAKTASSVRSIDMPAECVTLLREHRRRQNAVRLSAPPGIWQDNDLVFPGEAGNVLSSTVMERWLRLLCERAGVPTITPHSLRRSGVSLLRSLGVAPEVVGRRLGHKNLSELWRYSLEIPGEGRQASETLSAEVSRRRAGSGG